MLIIINKHIYLIHLFIQLSSGASEKYINEKIETQ